MAKVTLILEDTTEPDGTQGLLIDWDSKNDYEKGSLAHEYAAAFVQHIVGAAKRAEILDKDTVLVDSNQKPGKSPEDDQELN